MRQHFPEFLNKTGQPSLRGVPKFSAFLTGKFRLLKLPFSFLDFWSFQLNWSISVNSTFSGFSGNFLNKFLYHLSCLRNFRNFCLNEWKLSNDQFCVVSKPNCSNCYVHSVKMKPINEGDQASLRFLCTLPYTRSGTRLGSAVFLALQALNAVWKRSKKSSKNSAIVITENPIQRPNWPPISDTKSSIS